MIVLLFITSLIVAALSGVLAAGLPLSRRGSSLVGSVGMSVACALGFTAAAAALLDGGTLHVTRACSLPNTSLSLTIDPLAAFFLAIIFLVSGLAAVYGKGYLEKNAHGGIGLSWFFYAFLVTGMALVVAAANGTLFIIAWELMTISSYFLVTSDDEEEHVRKAGLLYLVASHCGVALLFLMFWILAANTGGSMDFDNFPHAALLSPGLKAALFLLAVVGFGVKAGFMPLHIWLPEAHPAAPSHVSALMSGVMIKTGIYGLLRIMTFLGPPPVWWAGVLIGVGIVSGVLGVLYALAQHDIKRMLAFSSVENIGIIALGIGIGSLGLACGTPAIAALGYLGALLHVFNHAIFKSILFMGAGNVLSMTGERDMNRLGGLIKRMPATGTTFLCGSVAVCGLPPLNGFVSELLIYLAAFQGLFMLTGVGAVLSLCVIIGLALIGGLAIACFTKVLGSVFLGEPRTAAASAASETPPSMLFPPAALVLICCVIGLFPLAAILVAMPAAAVASMTSISSFARETLQPINTFLGVYKAILLFLIFLTLLAFLRSFLLSTRRVERSVTWDCGYAAPTARMQYTGSAFSQPVVDFATKALGTMRHIKRPTGLFPTEASFDSKTPDIFTERMVRPVYDILGRLAKLTQSIQSGNTHLYILYIAAALLLTLLYRRFCG